MKYSKKIRGMSTALAFAFAFMVFSFSFAPKAYAADAVLGISYGGYFYLAPFADGSYGGELTYYFVDSETPVVNGSVEIGSRIGRHFIGDMRFNTYPEVTFGGPTRVYISYYPTCGAGTCVEVGDYMDASSWLCTYINAYNQEGVSTDITFNDFTQSASKTGRGYALEVGFQGSELNNIRALNIRRSTDAVGFDYYCANGNYGKMLYFPSIRIITSEYNAELDSLNNIADSIVAQNDLLLAMKGDIVAILQDIYEMTGDLWIAQDLTNQYLSAMLPLLENIDQTTTNIYALLGSQLRALETAINTSASTIEAAIEAQTAAMIAYLEEMFNTGNEVPSETYEQQQDAENILDQMESLEKPDVETIVPDIGDIGNDDMSGALSSIFSSNLIVTMMTLSASLAFGAYVLFGKRG